MRRNFAEVLKSGKIDIKKEYSKLYELFYGKDSRDDRSLAELISMNFNTIHFRGTCLDLDDFNQQYGFNFVEQPKDFNIDYLVSFCEYVYNFVVQGAKIIAEKVKDYAKRLEENEKAFVESMIKPME